MDTINNTPRKPTQAELQEIVYILVYKQGYDVTSFELEESYYIAVFDNYITNSPGYCGKYILMASNNEVGDYIAFIENKSKTGLKIVS